MAVQAQVECTGIYVPGMAAPVVSAPAASTKLNVSFTSVPGDPVQLGTITVLLDHDDAMVHEPGKTYSLTIG